MENEKTQGTGSTKPVKQNGGGAATAVGILVAIFLFSCCCFCALCFGTYAFLGYTAPSNISVSNYPDLPIDTAPGNPGPDLPADKVYELKDPVSINGGLRYKIIAVRESTTGDLIEKPKTGYKHVGINMNLTNPNTTRYFYSSSYFKLLSSAGNSYNTSLFSALEPVLKTGFIEAGKEVTGYLVFEVPAATKVSDLTLQYKNAENEIRWALL